jgi:hypothetical protein
VIDDAIFTILKNHSGVAGLTAISGGKFNIYPMRLPDGCTFPNGCAITYTQLGEVHPYPLLRKARFQISAFGQTYAEARALADFVYDALDDLRNYVVAGFSIVYSKFEGQQALYDSDAKLYYLAIDISIKF